MLEEKIYNDLKYLVSYPEGFSEGQKYPLVIFLHGAGTRGDSTFKLRNNGNVLNLQKAQKGRNYILLAPLCPNGSWYAWMTQLLGLMEEFRNLPYVDETRLHLTGNSMGGYGTWEICCLRPDWIASAMPICGGGIPGFGKKMVDVPVRAFHGLCDETVDPIESLEMVKAVNKKGGHAELILFPQLKHNCWDAVYTNERNIDWLLSFSTKRNKTLVDDYSGAYYG